MVRLKDTPTQKADLFCIISIPYGSIKSVSLFCKRSWFSISIPYGSIKRDTVRVDSIVYLQFQFLMVRLKARLVFLLPPYQAISIPYGSIKS